MTRAKPEDDEYWTRSKLKAFTFDDEDDKFSQLKESKRAVNSIFDEDDDDDEDDVERVNWSGEPVGSISWSVKETASSGHSGSEQGFPKIDTTPSLSKRGSGYSLSSLFKAKSKSGGFQSFSESFSDTSIRTYAPELRKPKSDAKDFVSDLNPEETVRRMRKGRGYSLEKFRSLQDKLLLLDEAVALYDGNVITAVLIYLKKSLNKEILWRELMPRDVALRHYLHYLKEMGEQKLLLELLRALGRTEDMALMQYKEHLNIKDEGKRKDFLKSCISLPFSQDDATHVQDHYTLLERQIIIEISEKQYILTALGARAKLKLWFDVDSLFNTKNWLGYTKKKSPIGFHRVVDILQKNNAPISVLQEYVNLIDDTELKLSTALKYKCHDIVINTYRDMKDRQQLAAYGGKLERDSPEYRKMQAILNNGQIKWKN
ncbi:spermatogenesis-defective protein 39 homolog isoform X2 [Misgurnus anguillicaudatus]|uniref:spermatogenesis-defective protein 39 homolog isoform X2 n=1 Tax=Misgurnus anguillicaudatus TaxID=75329 RepID=UPI003CCF594E